MTETTNKPYYNVRDRLLSVSFFKKTAEGNDGQQHTFYSANLQRSYQDKEGNWQRESINLYPDELLKLAALAQRGYNGLTQAIQSERELAKATGQSYPAQSMDAPEPPAWVNDDIPFA